MKYRVHEANTSSMEGRQRGGYRRMLFSTFPATYYRHAIRAVPPAKRLLALPLVPVKYVFEQARSYATFLGLLARKGRQVVRERARAAGHQVAGQ